MEKSIPDSNGNFSFKVPAKQQRLQINLGKDIIVKDINNFSLESIAKKSITPTPKKEKITKTAKVEHATKKETIRPYSDLSKHWIGTIANKLKLDGKLEDTKSFNPNQEITRADLAKYIVNINGIKTKKSAQSTFNDLKKTNPNYNNIQAVVSNKLLNGMSKNQFAPNRKVTKLQAIIVAARLLPENKNYENVNLPYNDVQKYKWANNNLKKAYHYKIISKSSKLNPNKAITKAELVSLLYKTSQI